MSINYKHELKITFFKAHSGKWYTTGTAYTNHQLFEEAFIQDILDTQDAMLDGFEHHEDMTLVIENVSDTGFHTCLKTPQQITGAIKRLDANTYNFDIAQLS